MHRAQPMRRRRSAATFAAAIVAGAVALMPGSPASATDNGRPAFDRNGDGRSDFALLRATSETAFTWFWISSSGFAENVFGDPTLNDVPVVGDFDGDGINDASVVRRGSPDHWFVQLSSSPGLVADVPFGDVALGDVPLTGDIDGDGRTDFVVFRPGSPATWFARSATGLYGDVAFGDTIAHNDTPALGDLDGDGRTDIIIRRRGDDESTFFHIRTARGGYPAAIHFGKMSDVYVPGDYNNDGIGDIAVVRQLPGSHNYRWFIRLSDTAVQLFTFGDGDRGDVLAQNDYDGNGSTDVAVWRPGSSGRLFIQPVPSGAVAQTSFGQEGDTPLSYWFNCFQNLPTLCAPD